MAVAIGASLGLNEIDNTISAKIGATNVSFISAGTGTLEVRASDDSKVESQAIGAAVGAAIGNTGVSVPIGVSLGFNTIQNKVEAVIVEKAVIDNPTKVTLTASSNAEIDAFAAAASVAIGVGGKAGVAVSGAGAAAKNVILSKTNAFVDQSTLISAGGVDIDALATSQIDATILSVSGSLGASQTAGVGASVGVAVSRNFIGWKPGGDNFDFTTDQAVDVIRKGKTVKVLGGVYDGDVYEFIGDDLVVYEHTNADGSVLLKENAQVKVGPAIYRFSGKAGTKVLNTEVYENSTDWELIGESDLSGQDFGKRDLWKLFLPDTIEDAATIQAYVKHSKITATGDVTLDAVAQETIEALTIAGSVALAGSSKVGVAFNGAGVGTENRIRNLVKAYVDSGSSTVSAKDLRITAHDDAKIKADAGTASVAGSAAGKVGVSVAIGIALAFNEISNEVEAYITDSTSVTTTGDVVLDAKSRGASAVEFKFLSTTRLDGPRAGRSCQAGREPYRRWQARTDLQLPGFP